MVSGVPGLPAFSRTRADRSGARGPSRGREGITDGNDGAVAPDWDGGAGFWAVAPGDAARLVAAYREATGQAATLVSAFRVAGLGAELVSVTAGLDPAGRPLVCGVLTLSGACRLAELLATGNPPPGLPVAEEPPSWAA